MFAVVQVLSSWAVPVLVLAVLIYGAMHKVKIYESFVEGAKEGLQVTARILPYLVAMLVAVELLQSSGGMKLLSAVAGRLLQPFGIPPEIVPLALLRPVSGSGAYGMLVGILEHYGPDSFIGRAASAIQGSTETTLYITTVYFGAVGISKVRYSVAVGLLADLVGFIAAVFATRLVFGGG